MSRRRPRARAAIRELDPGAALIGDAMLLASELVTNAVRHAGCRRRRTASPSAPSCSARGVRIEVCDPARSGSVPRLAADRGSLRRHGPARRRGPVGPLGLRARRRAGRVGGDRAASRLGRAAAYSASIARACADAVAAPASRDGSAPADHPREVLGLQAVGVRLRAPRSLSPVRRRRSSIPGCTQCHGSPRNTVPVSPTTSRWWRGACAIPASKCATHAAAAAAARRRS